MSGRRLRGLGVALALGLGVACQEDLAAPGVCPDFCPVDTVATRDTVLFLINGDSAARNYVRPYESAFLHVVNRITPALDARAFIVMNAVADSLEVDFTTPALEPVKYTQFARMAFTITRRDTATKNLGLAFYRLPYNADSTATFASLDPSFQDSLLIRRINVDTIIAAAGAVDSTRQDSICGDTVGTRRTDQGGHLDTARVDRAIVSSDSTRVTLLVVFDSTQLAFAGAPPDSGRVAIGVRVEADTLAQVVLGANEGNQGANIVWHQCFDSVTTAVRRIRPAVSIFDSFVFSPDTVPVGGDLVLGGLPSARSWLRFGLSDAFLDSNRVVRATLLLLPTVPAQGAVADSFLIEALGVQADFGAKSLILFSYQGLSVGQVDDAPVLIGSTDTLRLELGPLVRLWTVDHTLPRMVVLRAAFEGFSLAELRVGASTGPPASQPRLHVTYVPRYPFTKP